MTDIEQAAPISREDEPYARVSTPADGRGIFPLGPGLRCAYPGYGLLQLADGRAGFARGNPGEPGSQRRESAPHHYCNARGVMMTTMKGALPVRAVFREIRAIPNTVSGRVVI